MTTPNEAPAAPVQAMSASEKELYERWVQDYGLRHEPNYNAFTEADCKAAWIAARAIAPQAAAPVQADQHPDDLAVDRFAAAMKDKLAKARAKGRGGWDDPTQCSIKFLNHLLNEHVAKGDPVDVGNLAMMIQQRGGATSAATSTLPPLTDAMYWAARGAMSDNFAWADEDLDALWEAINTALRVSRPASPATAVQASEAPRNERKAFEVSARKMGLDITRFGDDYESSRTGLAWYGWQARASIPAPASPAAQPAEAQPDHDAWNLCSRLNGALQAIGDYAHDRSTGPAVLDALWEVRRMAYEAMEDTPSQPVAAQPVADKGPWQVDEWDERIVLQSHDFTHDVALIINGDFSDRAKKLEYARNLASQFNRASPLSPAAQAQGAMTLPPEIAAIAERLHTQDNRITADPLFVVQQKRRIYGLDTDYCDNAEWILNGETITIEPGEEAPDGARFVGYIDKWEFVTGCFTEQGCKDYIAVNGHNLNEPRIYAYDSYRNAEFIAMRKWLMSMRAASAPTNKEQG